MLLNLLSSKSPTLHASQYFFKYPQSTAKNIENRQNASRFAFLKPTRKQRDKRNANRLTFTQSKIHLSIINNDNLIAFHYSQTNTTYAGIVRRGLSYQDITI